MLLLPCTPAGTQENARQQGPLSQDDCAKLLRLTPEQLVQRLGPPTRKARQLLYQRCLEQWIYEQAHQVRVEIEFPRGQKPVIRTVGPLGNAP